MTIAICIDCGEPFERDMDEAWKSRCIDCWGTKKYGADYRPARRTAVVHVDPIRRELAGKMRALLQLCHPDRHSGSQLATSTTQWLLALLDQLENTARERTE